MSDETRKYCRCPKKILRARIICETVCKDRNCFYHPGYRERICSRSKSGADLPDNPFIDSTVGVKKRGIKAKKGGKI